MNQILEPLLRRVEKPARYTGGELNQICKPGQHQPLRMALAFPDVYEVGMSHLGIRILYHILNEREDTWCERVFAPWVDMERELRAAALPLTTLESATPLRDLDILGFTLQYEMSYTNILNMLDLGGIPLKSADRGASDPFVLCGGPCAYNPEPLWEFVDLFAIGDGEEVIGEIADAYVRWKRSGAPRVQFLRMAAGIPGIYVPALYTVDTHADGTLAAVTPTQGAPAVVHRRVLRDLDAAYWPEKPIVPFLDIVHDRITLEIFRGCTRGCRFCQAGMVYRPVRERSVDTLVRNASNAIAATGYDEISLSSLSTGDYSQLPELISALQAGPCSGQVSLSLPSLRLDAHAKAYMDALEGGRKGGLTLAPEAGTQRLRDVINKGVTEDDLIQSLDNAFAAGWSRVKFYFMLGLPTETDEDIEGIAHLTRLALHRYRLLPKEKRRRPLSITVSTASFVPKADTPFQWCPQLDVPELMRRQQLLRGLLKAQGVKYSWHDAQLSHMEAVFARGGRALSAVLLHAWRAGCRFDGWSDHFDYTRWLAAFEKAGVDPAFYANRQYGADERLPWDHIHCGVDKAFLRAEYDCALQGRTTPDCRQGCLACGLMAQCPLAGGDA